MAWATLNSSGSFAQKRAQDDTFKIIQNDNRGGSESKEMPTFCGEVQKVG